jgi:hypothetical protein
MLCVFCLIGELRMCAVMCCFYMCLEYVVPLLLHDYCYEPSPVPVPPPQLRYLLYAALLE